MNKLQVINNKNIESMIYEIRGKQVMLDRDLAKLYGVETKVFMQSVKRNIERFPQEFMFQLTKEEFMNWRSQFVTSNGDKMGLRRSPYVFTEQGVAMLSSVLHSKVAIETSIKIMNAFVCMRHYIGNDLIRLSNIESKIIDHDNSIKYLLESFNKLEENKEVSEIYFDGKIYDAYSKIIDLFKEAKKELVIIDRYTDKTILDMIKNIGVDVKLITSKKSKLTGTDIQKYNTTYNNLSIYYDDTYHDRFFIIDKNKIYHSGNSINHIGYRKSSKDVLYDDKIKNTIIEDVNIIIKK